MKDASYSTARSGDYRRTVLMPSSAILCDALVRAVAIRMLQASRVES